PAHSDVRSNHTTNKAFLLPAHENIVPISAELLFHFFDLPTPLFSLPTNLQRPQNQLHNSLDSLFFLSTHSDVLQSSFQNLLHFGFDPPEFSKDSPGLKTTSPPLPEARDQQLRISSFRCSFLLNGFLSALFLPPPKYPLPIFLLSPLFF